MLGVFVNGVVVYGYGEIFKGKRTSNSDFPSLYFTELNISDSFFSLSWATAHTVFTELKCEFHQANICASEEINQTGFVVSNQSNIFSFSLPPLSRQRDLQTITKGLNLSSSRQVYQIELQRVILFQDILNPNEQGLYTYVQTGLQPRQNYSFLVENTVTDESSGRFTLVTESRGNFSSYGGGGICEGIQKIYFPCIQ